MSSKTSLVMGWVATKHLAFWLLQSPVQKGSRGLSGYGRKSHVLLVLQQQCRSFKMMPQSKVCIQTFPFLVSLCAQLLSELEGNCKV